MTQFCFLTKFDFTIWYLSITFTITFMSKQPRSLVDLSLCKINHIDQLKQLAQFEAIRERMFHVFDYKLQRYILGESKTWYDDGTLREHGYFRDGRLHGEYREWYFSGVPKTISQYKHGLHNGEHREWYLSGIPKLHVNYVDGYLQGEGCWWFSDGTIDCHMLFDGGVAECTLP
jgi:hypothetical protein